MERQRQRDTQPELALRRELHRRGLRYRLDVVVVGKRRRVDIAFTRARVAVFVDGCFWHSCPQHLTVPKNNQAWWIDKLSANVRRDRASNAELAEAGWRVVRVWEHEPCSMAANKIERIVRARLQAAAGARRT
jgi:DNA mismatch endonuclease (patch repair protein)